MFSLFAHKEEDVVAIFDIGNGSIGGAFVQFSKNQPPTILYAHREPLTFLPHVTSPRLLSTMTKLLRVVTLKMHKDGLPQVENMTGSAKVHSAYCIFSSPWFISQTKVLKVKKDKPFTVTSGLINNLIETEEEQFQAALKAGEYENKFGEDVRLLEKKIITTTLNGYEVQVPVGKEAKEFEITFFLSLISKKILDEVEQELSHTFHFKKLHYFSYALASWSAIRDMLHDTKDFLFMDITGEVTDITLTISGILSQSISFPVGRAALVRHIVEELEVLPEVALSYINMHTKGMIEEKIAKKVEVLIKKAQDNWHQNFIEAITGLEKFHALPKKVYVTVDRDVGQYYAETLSQALPLELNIPDNAFDVLVLDAEMMRSYTKQAGSVSEDPFLLLESIFVQKII